jgi:hypothetical protein
MWRVLLRILGAVIGGCALLMAFPAWMFRMDSGDELPFILRVDVVIGLALAVAVILLRVPAAGEGTARWHAWTAAWALLAWLLLFGGLAGCHYAQCRVRFTPPITSRPAG